MDPLQIWLSAHGGVITSGEATRLGISATGLTRLVASGSLLRVCRGGYIDAARLSGTASPEQRHALRVRAVLRANPGGYAASHQSAAALLGLPLLARDLDRVHVVRDGGRGHGRTRTAFVVHEAPPTEGITAVQGLRSVAAVPAVLGTAMTASAWSGQAVVDRALGAGLVSREELLLGLSRRRHHPGVAAARRAVVLADPSSESLGESALRPVLVTLGYRVRSQARLMDRDGRFVARVDFLLTDLGVVVEFDGALKYDGAEGRDALVREKVREDGIRALGFGVVRVTWGMLGQPAAIAVAIDRARRTVGRAA